jgi:hypothetical protein
MLDAHIAHELAPDGEVVSRAVELATELSSKDHSVVTAHKLLMYADVMAAHQRRT